ncbi:MAG: hypothetical protein ACRD0K_02585, partial [Egibacteraceae bacterium]
MTSASARTPATDLLPRIAVPADPRRLPTPARAALEWRDLLRVSQVSGGVGLHASRLLGGWVGGGGGG